MNMGTKINQVLDKQDFNWHLYGTVNLYSTPNGLKALVNSRTQEATWFHINDNGNDTFQIAKGLQNDEVVDDNVPTSELSSRVHQAIMNK
jgi:hypothetical protein